MVTADAPQLAAQGARHFAFVDADRSQLGRHGLHRVHPDPAVDELWAQRRQEAVEVGATRCCVRC